MKKIYEYRVLFVLTIIVALDHVLKYAIHSTLMLGESITVIPGFFSIVYVKNYGIVFGIFNENNTWFVIGLAIVSIAILFVMVWLYTRIAKEDVYARAGLILIIAGALGNLISRLSYGYVVDMFSFYINGYSWPAFNIADASISIGATLIILTLIFFTDREKNIFS